MTLGKLVLEARADCPMNPKFIQQAFKGHCTFPSAADFDPNVEEADRGDWEEVEIPVQLCHSETFTEHSSRPSQHLTAMSVQRSITNVLS